MKKGLWCSKCKKLTQSATEARIEGFEKKEDTGLYVVDKSDDNLTEIRRSCPECGNSTAFRWLSKIAGEHAGVRRERIVEHFRCTKCSYKWSESS